MTSSTFFAPPALWHALAVLAGTVSYTCFATRVDPTKLTAAIFGCVQSASTDFAAAMHDVHHAIGQARFHETARPCEPR